MISKITYLSIHHSNYCLIYFESMSICLLDDNTLQQFEFDVLILISHLELRSLDLRSVGLDCSCVTYLYHYTLVP